MKSAPVPGNQNSINCLIYSVIKVIDINFWFYYDFKLR